MSSGELDSIIAIGHDTTATKYYALAACTILFYDYFLMLADEIEYVWFGQKSWMFWIFIANRYFPMTFQFWLLAFSYSPHFPSEGCARSVFYSTFTLTICVLLAQVVLTARIYAVTMKNVPITAGFVVIAATQLAVGIWLIILAAEGGVQPFPPIPLDAYRFCLIVRHKPIEIAFTSIQVVFDFFAFSLIIFLAVKSRVANLRGPTLLETIAEDATLYFLVIFGSHLALEFTLTLGRDSIQSLPGFAQFAFLPVMISRLAISLRKTASTQRTDWTTGDLPPDSTGPQTAVFFRTQRGTDLRGDDIPLDTIPRQ